MARNGKAGKRRIARHVLCTRPEGSTVVGARCTLGREAVDEIAIIRRQFLAGSSALAAFDYLIERADAAGFRLVPRLSAVKSVELQWPNRRQNPYSAQAQPAHVNFYLRRPILKMHPQLFAAAEREFGHVRPNSLGEYRTHLRSPAEVERMLEFLMSHGAWPKR